MTRSEPGSDTGSVRHLFHPELRERIARHLGAHPATTLHEPGLRQAAVAIAVVPTNGESAGFILTRRTAGMRAHAHQYALPGGRIDDGESAEQTAVRELQEEVGIAAHAKSIIGVLDDYKTRSGYIITPVVMWLDDLVGLKAQPGEVDEIHIVDVHELDRADSPRWITIAESDLPVIQLPIKNRLIHAPTGALLYQFREICLWGRTARTDTIEEPVWAWR